MPLDYMQYVYQTLDINFTLNAIFNIQLLNASTNVCMFVCMLAEVIKCYEHILWSIEVICVWIRIGSIALSEGLLVISLISLYFSHLMICTLARKCLIFILFLFLRCLQAASVSTTQRDLVVAAVGMASITSLTSLAQQGMLTHVKVCHS